MQGATLNSLLEYQVVLVLSLYAIEFFLLTRKSISIDAKAIEMYRWTENMTIAR